MPLPAPGQSLPDDCDFYRGAWQTFLYVTQPTNYKPTFLNYKTFEDVFKIKPSPLFADAKPGLLSLAPRSVQSPNSVDVATSISDLEQAGLQQVLIDQSGNAVWYAIHLNDEFVKFVHDYNLTDVNVLKQIPAELQFRAGVVELKSAWRIVEGPVPKNFITTRATIPIFKHDSGGKIVRDGNKSRAVTVALLSLHVVSVIEGHPEFIWATFEHVTHRQDGAWVRDVAPSSKGNPNQTPVLVEALTDKYAVYPADPNNKTAPPVADANAGNPLQGLKLDEKSQKFSPLTPVYRIFPASKSSETDEDDEIVKLNDSVKKLFKKFGTAETDVRSNYQLVAAVWLNTPGADFKSGVNFSDTDPNAPPRTVPLFGGENRLSNMALESFTQPENSFPNCFSCHDTDRAGTKSPKLGISKLNVSHVLSKFYDLTKK
jgi:hypothetical protein